MSYPSPPPPPPDAWPPPPPHHTRPSPPPPGSWPPRPSLEAPTAEIPRIPTARTPLIGPPPTAPRLDPTPPATPAPPATPPRREAETGFIKLNRVLATIAVIVGTVLLVLAILWTLTWLRDKAEEDKYDDYGHPAATTQTAPRYPAAAPRG
ncbi:hypothetical protein AB0I28_09750 [Phytomonospora sp. NPDC050363]|uniref:hypothetical protein n=1 Tax=Phytomonospora sp. NPDC050363 TaxID=3155642 RepID=UPI0033D95D1D